MNGAKITIYENEFFFEKSAEVLTLIGVVLEMITDYIFFATDSPVAKLFIDFMDEIRFEIHARGKCFRDKNLIKNISEKRTIFASGLKRSEKNIFLPEIPKELCDRLCLLIQEKQVGNDTNRFDNEVTALFDKILQYKCIINTKRETN